MLAVIILGFLLAAVLAVWAAAVALSGRTRRWVRVFYFCCLAAAVVAAYQTTYHYSYFRNSNTQMHGWPVPTVVFQRDSPTSPWLDFVGPTTVLAYPMNVLLFVLIPSIASLVFARRANSRTEMQGGEKEE